MTETNPYWPGLESSLTAADGYEEKLDALRVHARTERQRIRERDEAGRLPLTDLFRELSLLAEAVLYGSLETAWHGLLDRPGAEPPAGDFAVVAMGKLGGRELTYRSDLDLIYIYEDPSDQEFYGRLGARILSALSLLTRQGIAYAVDTALRPSGNRGTLVSSLASFLEYHRTLGRTWERQALVKAHAVVGARVAPSTGKAGRSLPLNAPSGLVLLLPGQSEFLSRLEKEIEAIAYQDYDPKRIAGEIDLLRGRMEREIARERPGRFNLKTGRGGLVDIEFAVQYLQLVHGAGNPKVRNRNTISALRALAAEGILGASLAETLERSYLFLREIETRLRLLLDGPADDVSEGAEWLGELEVRYFGGGKIIPRLIETRERVRSAYERIFRA
jgi:glutamate-ammonia-ligase adenylyltransferase